MYSKILLPSSHCIEKCIDSFSIIELISSTGFCKALLNSFLQQDFGIHSFMNQCIYSFYELRLIDEWMNGLIGKKADTFFRLFSLVFSMFWLVKNSSISST